MSNKITIIKTNIGCFITDCDKTKGYDYKYHNSKIPNYYFDNKKATETYVQNWYMIDSYPKSITVKESSKRVNEIYELIDKDLKSKKTPLTIKKEDFEYDYEDPIYSLYTLKYDIEEGSFIDADVELDLLMEVSDFQLPPKFNYKGINSDGFSDKEYTITNANIQHQWLDKMIIPEIMLHEKHCKIDSSTLYNLVRAHIKENIDKTVAVITSDHKFCFTVKKLIPLYEPKKYTYTNPFASTKKQRQKLHHGVQEYRQTEIFEMTTISESYKGYTPIQPITANNEKELKEKLDIFLEDLMTHINRPLSSCPHCKGTGYIEDIKPFDLNKR